jgi:small ligand-binding sensory domain FIST
MPFAAALSEHPLATHAVGEVVGEVLERLGDEPDLALLFVSADRTGAVDDIVESVRRLLRPRVLVGCTTGTVVAGGREVEDTAAISLWATRLPMVVPLRLTHTTTADGTPSVRGFPDGPDLPPAASAVILLADPFSFPTEAVLTGLRVDLGVDLPVVGGLASAARGPGGNRLVLDGRVFTDGAVAVVVGGVDAATIVSQGCRPVGDPMIVTAGEGSLVQELAGRPALERVRAILDRLDADDLEAARRGLHIGRVVDEHRAEFGRGDFIVRNVLGAVPASGSVAVGDEVTVGSTVQLHVRDAATADDDLHALLAGARADGALLFTCTGRGTHMFGERDHDAAVVADLLGAPVAGMSCEGELGPIGGRSFLHGFTASILLLTDST